MTLPSPSNSSSPETLLNTDTFNVDHWPVVQSHYPAADVPSRMELWLGGIDTLLKRKDPFVLIVSLPDADPQEEAHEDRKKSALWFKQAKEALAQHCLGFIYIIPNEEMRREMSDRAPMMEKAFSVKLRIATDEDEAMQQAKLLTR